MTEEDNQIQSQLNKIIDSVNNLAQKFEQQEARLNKIEQRASQTLKENNSLIGAPQQPLEPPPYRPEKVQKETIVVDYGGLAGKRFESPQAAKGTGEIFTAKMKEAFEAEEPSVVQSAKGARPTGKNIESEIGLKWLGRIGIVAIIFGVAFFLKYAFDNDWIGETGRVVLGIIGGLVLALVGEVLRKKYLIFAQILTGGGIAILYLSIYAAFGFYHLIGQGVALGAMALVTFIAGALAIHYEGLALAGMGIFGGFLTPILLSAGDNNQIGLFTYMAILDIGILGISFFRHWRGLNLLGLMGTGFLFFSWYEKFYTPNQLFLTIFFLSIYFVIYAIATIAHNIVIKQKTSNLDAALITFNALAYFGASYGLLNLGYHNYMGFLAAVMALFYFILAVSAYRLNSDDKYLALFLPGLSVLFLTIAAPIQFDGHWITIAWVVEALILSWLGFKLNNYGLRIFSWIIFVLATIKLIAIDSRVGDLSAYIIIFNKRFLTFLVAIVCTFIISYLYSWYRSSARADEIKAKIIWALIGNFLLLGILSAELLTHFDKQINENQPTSPTCQLESYRDNQYTKSSYCEREAEEYQAKLTVWFNQREGIENTRNVALTILWGLYAIIMSIVGIFGKNRALRLVGIALFAVTIIKLFFFDLWSLGTLYRIVCSVSLGLILLLASFAYNKYKDKIKEII